MLAEVRPALRTGPLSNCSHARSHTILAPREECLSLVRRLQDDGLTNASMYLRNILVQPGPLSAPRDERTMEKPSFRLIDFGRAVLRRKSGFEKQRKHDLDKATALLSL